MLLQQVFQRLINIICFCHSCIFIVDLIIYVKLQGGFKSSLMLKDLGLVQEVAKRSGTPIPFGSNTFEIYKTLCDQQKGHLDFSVVYQYISELKSE